MEKLAKSIAASIGRHLEKSEEDVAVIAYGLIGILQLLAILVISLTIGIIFGFWAEVLTIFFSVGFLRRYSAAADAILSLFLLSTAVAGLPKLDDPG